MFRLSGGSWTLDHTFEGDETIHAEPIEPFEPFEPFEEVALEMSPWLLGQGE